jgi:hypothetical protein
MSGWPRLCMGLAVLCSCGGGSPDRAKKLIDTGWFTDTADWVGDACRHRIVTTQPADKATGWYWREPLELFVSTEQHERYETYLIDADGIRLPVEPEWSEEGLSAKLTVPGGLRANHTYTWHVHDCLEDAVVTFQTSEFGEPLTGGASSLTDRTYLLDLTAADWTQPPGLGPVLALYFTTPVLLGVEVASVDSIDFLGAPGAADPLAGVIQDRQASTWDFGATSFASSPYFEAEVDEVIFAFQGTSVVVNDFRLEGTFNASGEAFGGALLTGQADTRHLGMLLGDPDNLGAMCEYAGKLGIFCDPCPDGESYCLDMAVEDLEGLWVPGLELVKR